MVEQRFYTAKAGGSNPSPRTMKKELECIVRGKVQMVMFRDFVQRNARNLRLVGRVRNMKDGTVHVIAQGSEDVLHDFLRRLSKGSLLAKVDFISVCWRAPKDTYEGFIIEY